MTSEQGNAVNPTSWVRRLNKKKKKATIELSKTTQQDSSKDKESLIHSSLCSLKVVLRSDKSERHAFCYCMKYVFTHVPKLAQVRVVPHVCKWPWLFPSVLSC